MALPKPPGITLCDFRQSSEEPVLEMCLPCGQKEFRRRNVTGDTFFKGVYVTVADFANVPEPISFSVHKTPNTT